jgi:hypothetical protein
VRNVANPVRGRRPTGPLRAFLDRDAGPLDDMALPHPAGSRPIPPFLHRDTVRLGGPRWDAQLFPSTSIAGRTLAHVTYPGLRHGQRAPARNVSGALTPAKVTRSRPWLFGGGSLAQAIAEGPSKPGKGDCDGCDK